MGLADLADKKFEGHLEAAGVDWFAETAEPGMPLEVPVEFGVVEVRDAAAE